MFRKPNSSTHSRGKKCKDVPLRKSDRKQLRQLIGDCVLATNNDETISESETDDSIRTAVNQRLDHVVLQGTLLSRSIELPTPSSSSSSSSNLPYYKSCTLYYRSPDDGNDHPSITDSSASSSTSWPYTRHAQCVWIQVVEQDVRLKSKQVTHNMPGLALLSVLPITSRNSVFGRVYLNSPDVSEYLCRGAHLMRAGMRLVEPPKVATSPVVLVYIRHNPQCLAVGILQEPDKNNNINSRSGVGVHIVQCYGDDLWQQQTVGPSSSSAKGMGPINDLLGGGAPYNNGHYGNAGFLDGKRVVPILVEAAKEEEKEEADDKDESGISEEESFVLVDHDQPDADAANEETTGDPKSIQYVEAETASEEETPPPVAPLSADEVLHTAVCKALSMLQAKRDLPMTMANFYSQHVIPNRPQGTMIELKQTKWKKFGAYVKEQVEAGLLVVGSDDAKKDPMAMLVGFNASRDVAIKAFREQAKLSGADVSSQDKKLVISDLYIVPPHIATLLQLDPEQVKATNATSEERKNTGMLTLKEVRAMLEGFVEREELVAPGRPDLVNMNGPLLDALYGKNNKQDAPASLSRKDLVQRWLSKMQSAYALVETPGNRVLKLARGSPPKIEIIVTKRQNKKFVTHVRGLEEYGIHAPSFCTDVSHRFACSGSMEENPDTALKKNHVELQFQGNLVDELEALLLGDASLTSHGGAQNSDYRIPKGCIDAVLRKGVPARKKQSGKK